MAGTFSGVQAASWLAAAPPAATQTGATFSYSDVCAILGSFALYIGAVIQANLDGIADDVPPNDPSTARRRASKMGWQCVLIGAMLAFCASTSAIDKNNAMIPLYSGVACLGGVATTTLLGRRAWPKVKKELSTTEVAANVIAWELLMIPGLALALYAAFSGKGPLLTGVGGLLYVAGLIIMFRGWRLITWWRARRSD